MWDNPCDCDVLRVKLMLGNIEELRDYHKHVMLPKMETAVDNAVIMRWVVTSHSNIQPLFTINLFIIDMNIAEETNFPQHNLVLYLELMNG